MCDAKEWAPRRHCGARRRRLNELISTQLHPALRCSLIERWQPLPFLPGFPIAVHLVRDGSNWVLIDAGVPAQASQLLEALHAAVPPNDTLAAIVCKSAAWVNPSSCEPAAASRLRLCHQCTNMQGPWHQVRASRSAGSTLRYPGDCCPTLCGTHPVVSPPWT